MCKIFVLSLLEGYLSNIYTPENTAFRDGHCIKSERDIKIRIMEWLGTM